MIEWKTIKAPKMLHLPVKGDNFTNSGCRVEPSDLIRIKPGTNQIEINGVEGRLMIPCNNLRLDAQGVIQLNRPAPPVRLSSGGKGRASVSATGGARLHSKGNFDIREAETWEGDGASHIGSIFEHHHPIPGRDPVFAKQAHARGATSNPAANTGNPDVDEFFDEFAAHMAKGTEPSEMREITLRDGSKGRALFSTVTGRQIGASTRDYQVRHDDAGHQLANPTGTHGPASSFDLDAHRAKNAAEYRRRLDKQTSESQIAPTGHDLHREAPAEYDPALNAPVGAPQAKAPEVTPRQAFAKPRPTTTLGSPHLDNLIGVMCGEIGKPVNAGMPLGLILHLSGPADLRKALLGAAGALYAPSLEAAIGKMFMRKENQAPLIVVELENYDLAKLAEELPAAAEAFEEATHDHEAALVISTPENAHPRLMGFICHFHVKLTPHERDERYITATCSDEGGTETTSFPAPGLG